MTHKRPLSSARNVVSASILVVLFASQFAQASDRRFTYVYEATTQPKGAVEFEQWGTWKTHKRSDSTFDRFDIRHEIEFGLTDRLQMGIYLADWRYEDGRSVDNDGADYRDTAVEFIYNLSDPVNDALGSAIYGEIKLGDELFELEAKLILQKNVGKWVFAWNGTIEAEWEGSDYSEDKGKLAQSFGASYQFSPKFTAGIELLHEVENDDWREWQDHVLYIGPNFSYRADTWWVTVTPLFQITDEADEADFQARFIFGFNF